MKNLKFKGKLVRQKGVTYIGNGYIKQDNGKEFILNGEDKVEIIPGSLKISEDTYQEFPIMHNPDITLDQVDELHQILVDTAIKYLSDKNIKKVEEVAFSADSLQASTKAKKWTCFTDSSICLVGYEDGQRKLIAERM